MGLRVDTEDVFSGFKSSLLHQKCGHELLRSALASSDEFTISRHEHKVIGQVLKHINLVVLKAGSTVICVDCENFFVTIDIFAQSKLKEGLSMRIILEVNHCNTRMAVLLVVCLNDEICALESLVPLSPRAVEKTGILIQIRVVNFSSEIFVIKTRRLFIPFSIVFHSTPRISHHEKLVLAVTIPINFETLYDFIGVTPAKTVQVSSITVSRRKHKEILV